MKSQPVSGGDTALAAQYNDLRLDAKSASYLYAHQQSTPDLTLKVEAGQVYFGSALVEFAGGNSPSFTAPATNPRIDILSLDSTGTLIRTAGTEAASPTAPAVPAGNIPICQVYNRVGQTSIKDENDSTNGYIYKDLRSFIGVPQPISAIVSDNLKQSNDTEKISDYSLVVWTLAKRIWIRATGNLKNAAFRIKFDLRVSSSGGSASAAIYRNGVLVGTIQTDSNGNYITFSEDITGWDDGDYCELWYVAQAGRYAYVRNFRIYYDLSTFTIGAVSFTNMTT